MLSRSEILSALETARTFELDDVVEVLEQVLQGLCCAPEPPTGPTYTTWVDEVPKCGACGERMEEGPDDGRGCVEWTCPECPIE